MTRVDGNQAVWASSTKTYDDGKDTIEFRFRVDRCSAGPGGFPTNINPGGAVVPHRESSGHCFVVHGTTSWEKGVVRGVDDAHDVGSVKTHQGLSEQGSAWA